MERDRQRRGRVQHLSVANLWSRLADRMNTSWGLQPYLSTLQCLSGSENKMLPHPEVTPNPCLCQQYIQQTLSKINASSFAVLLHYSRVLLHLYKFITHNLASHCGKGAMCIHKACKTRRSKIFFKLVSTLFNVPWDGAVTVYCWTLQNHSFNNLLLLFALKGTATACMATNLY